jgi:hypothetical protein
MCLLIMLGADARRGFEDVTATGTPDALDNLADAPSVPGTEPLFSVRGGPA